MTVEMTIEHPSTSNARVNAKWLFETATRVLKKIERESRISRDEIGSIDAENHAKWMMRNFVSKWWHGKPVSHEDAIARRATGERLTCKESAHLYNLEKEWKRKTELGLPSKHIAEQALVVCNILKDENDRFPSTYIMMSFDDISTLMLWDDE